MQPFNLTPTHRISVTDKNFTLERLSTPRKKKDGEDGAEDKGPTWKQVAFFGRLEHVIEAWRSDYILEHDGTLPGALRDAYQILQEKTEELKRLLKGDTL